MNIETLKKLLKDCLLITPERRAALLARIDTLKEDQIQEMSKAITEANDSIKNIIAVTMENPENQQKVDLFNQQIDQIWKQYKQNSENITDGIEDQQADKLLTEL